MGKKILISASMLVFVSAIVIGATGAFFSDSETSAGNTFTAGAISLKVDSTSHYNNTICENTGTVDAPVYTWQLAEGQTAQPDQYPVIGSTCTETWLATTLGLDGPAFFDFTDVKPQDQGENTISLDNNGNPAWLCADITLTDNASSTNGTAFDGNLANNLELFAWRDTATTSGATAGDNIYEPGAGEVSLFGPETVAALFGGSASTTATTTIALIDSVTGGGTPLPGGSDSYIGMAWCAGTMTVNSTTGAITCDGTSMGNNTQNNSLMANITLMAEQSRNLPDYTCTAPVGVAPTTGSLTVIKHVVHSGAGDAGITASNFSITVASSSGDVAGSPQPGSEIGTFYATLDPATYTVTETGSITVPEDETVTAVYSGDCAGVDTVGVTAGTSKTCTITNTYATSTIPG